NQLCRSHSTVSVRQSAWLCQCVCLPVCLVRCKIGGSSYGCCVHESFLEVRRMARIRSRGEGSISKRKDGRFEVRVSLGVIDGRRQQVHYYAKTRADAVELLRQARQEARPGGRAANTGAETVGQFMDRWLEQVVSRNRR